MTEITDTYHNAWQLFCFFIFLVFLVWGICFYYISFEGCVFFFFFSGEDVLNVGFLESTSGPDAFRAILVLAQPSSQPSQLLHHHPLHIASHTKALR